MTKNYQFDPDQRVWFGPSESTLTYSDGDESEEYLFSVIVNAKDVSSNSPELASAIKDWPSEYHLSPIRHNLLRPFPFGSSARILELGCGCGAMTRYLGETGATVIAVEGSRRRAAIAAERCRDLGNVRVYCDNLTDFLPDEKFDYVTLIGVLEYAPKFIEGADPVGRCLQRAHDFLKEDGALILAIENKLGLKYLAGVPEDHLGIPFVGIYDAYGTHDPTTWGKAELTDLLQRVGLFNSHFFFPFPDYKLPRLLVSERALCRPNFRVADLLAGLSSNDPVRPAFPSFHEGLVWPGIAKNGLLADLANSFLVVSAKQNCAVRGVDAQFLAGSYATQRQPAFATETCFFDIDRGIVVHKRALLNGVGTHNAILCDNVLTHRVGTVTDYVAGSLYISELRTLLTRNEGLVTVGRWAGDWLDLLLTQADTASGQGMLPGIWLDAVPQNFLRAADSSLRRIDDEWELSAPFPLTWLVIRGLTGAIGACPTSSGLAGATLRESIRYIASLHNIHLDNRAFDSAITCDAKLRSIVYGLDEGRCMNDFVTLLDQVPHSLDYGPLNQERLANQNRLLEQEILRIKATLSWHITKPLRFIAFLWRKLFQTLRKA